MQEERAVSALTGEERGVWCVTTLGSSHILNLDRGTVTRIPGRGRSVTFNDVERPLRSIEACRVGEVGRWTMTPDNNLIDYYWHRTSTIQSIERLTGMALGQANAEVAFQNIRAADGMYSTDEVADILDLDDATVAAMLAAYELLGITWNDEVRFPGVQFDRDSKEVRPFAKPLMEAARNLGYPIRDLTFWLYGPTTYLEGSRPVDHLDRPELIVETFQASAGVEW